MANRRISDLQEIAGISLDEADLIPVVQINEVDPALQNKKLTISGTKTYLNYYYLPRTGGTISGSVTIQNDLTVNNNLVVSGITANNSVTVSGLIVKQDATVTGTISGNTVTGEYIRGTNINGVTITASQTVTGETGSFTSGQFQSLSGSTVTGDTINVTTITGISGVFTGSVSGATVTGNIGRFSVISGISGTFASGFFTSLLSGVTITGTTGRFSTLTGISGVFTTRVSGATVTGNTLLVSNATGVSGTFTTRLSGATVTGDNANFTSGTFQFLSAVNQSFGSSTVSGSFTVLSGLFVSGSGYFASGVSVTGTISGQTITGTLVSATTVNSQYGNFLFLTGDTTTGITANFYTLSGTTITGESGKIVSLTGNAAGFTTITGTTVTGTTANFVSGNFSTRISGVTLVATTGQITTLTGTDAGFTTITGTTVTGTTANFVSGVFTSRISGASITGSGAGFTVITGTTVTGATANFVSGVFTSQISGATITGTNGVFTVVSGGTAGFGTVTGTTVTGTTANFNLVSGTTVTGATANFISGTFTSRISGAVITGDTANFVTTTIATGVFASGSVTAPSITFTGNTDTGFYNNASGGVSLSTSGALRWRVDNAGRMLIGPSGGSLGGAYALLLNKDYTGASDNAYIAAVTDIKSDVTATARIFRSNPTTDATGVFTLTNLHHFTATPGTFGTGTVVTNQVGFHANSTVTGAVNNYGFFSFIPSGTGNYAFYAKGTADSQFNSSNFIFSPGGTERIRVNNGGVLLVGTSATRQSRIGTNLYNAQIQTESESSNNTGLSLSRFVDSASSTFLQLQKGRGTIASPASVISGDQISTVMASAYESGVANWINATLIQSLVDGTVASGSVPGRLIFGTNSGNATTPTERLRITSSGYVGVATTVPAGTMHIAGNTIVNNTTITSGTLTNSFSVSGEETAPHGIFFKPDGTRMYILGDTGNDVTQYILSTPWNVTTSIASGTFAVGSQDASPRDLYVRSDGRKMWMLGRTNNTVYQYTLKDPWEVTTASYDSVSFSVLAQETTAAGLYFKSNGKTFYVVGQTTDTVFSYNCTTAWDISTATLGNSFSVTSQEATPSAVAFTEDGTQMYVMGGTGDDINIYNLTAPWDISTASFNTTFPIDEPTSQGLYVRPDGGTFYVVGTTNQTVYAYTSSVVGQTDLTGLTNVHGNLTIDQNLQVNGAISGGVGLTLDKYLLLGSTTAYSVDGTYTKQIQSHSTSAGDEGLALVNWGTGTLSPSIDFAKSKAGTVGTYTLPNAEENIGRLRFYMADGVSSFKQAAAILAVTDGTPSATSSAARLDFSTTASGYTSPIIRFRIDADGLISCGFNATSGVARSTILPTKFRTSSAGFTDITTAESGTVAHVTSVTFANHAFIAANSGVTYTNASTVYIPGAPTAGANATITNAYALYVASNPSYFASTTLIGTPTSRGIGFSVASLLQLETGGQAASFTRNSNDTTGAQIAFGKSRGTSAGSVTAVVSGDQLAQLRFAGADGNNLESVGAQILVSVDNTVASGSVPARIAFSTTASGGTTPTERMRITSSGQVLIATTGANNNADLQLNNTNNNWGNISRVISAAATFGTGVQFANGITTTLSTAASGSITDAYHFSTNQGTFNTVPTNQMGFIVGPGITGATNNYGFYGNLASGTGRWNFYANGTADSYFASSNFIWANGGTERARFDSSGKLLLGTSSALGPTDIGNAQVEVLGTTSSTSQISIGRFANDNDRPRLTFIRSRGATVGTNTIVQSGDSIGAVEFRGTDGVSSNPYLAGANIVAAVDDTPASGIIPGRIQFATTNTAGIITERMRITSSGFVGIGTAAPAATLHVSGLAIIASGITSSGTITCTTGIVSTSKSGGVGYTTGAGSGITQTTSRTQGVTVNSVCGAITLVSAAGTTAWQSFTVTNSAVATTDTVIVNQKSGTDLYEIHVTNVGAGTFQLTYRTTAGTTIEQPVFNFSVIKAVAA